MAWNYCICVLHDRRIAHQISLGRLITASRLQFDSHTTKRISQRAGLSASTENICSFLFFSFFAVSLARANQYFDTLQYSQPLQATSILHYHGYAMDPCADRVSEDEILEVVIPPDPQIDRITRGIGFKYATEYVQSP